MKIGIVTGEIAALAIGALDRPERDDVIGAQAIALLVLLFAPLQVLETRVGSEINFVPLIVEIRPFVDESEVLNRKAVFPKAGRSSSILICSTNRRPPSCASRGSPSAGRATR